MRFPERYFRPPLRISISIYTSSIGFDDDITPPARFETSRIVKSYPEEVGLILRAISEALGIPAASHAWVEGASTISDFGLTSEQVGKVGVLLGISVRGWETFEEITERLANPVNNRRRW